MTREELLNAKHRTGYTTAQISEKTKIPVGTLNKLFSGVTRNPRRETIVALEQFFLKDDGWLGKVKKGDCVVITHEGPKGGPGMQEMLYPTSYIKSMHMGKECALITDGRFSGGTSGLSIGHISPEAALDEPRVLHL